MRDTDTFTERLLALKKLDDVTTAIDCLWHLGQAASTLTTTPVLLRLLWGRQHLPARLLAEPLLRPALPPPPGPQAAKDSVMSCLSTLGARTGQAPKLTREHPATRRRSESELDDGQFQFVAHGRLSARAALRPSDVRRSGKGWLLSLSFQRLRRKVAPQLVFHRSGSQATARAHLNLSFGRGDRCKAREWPLTLRSYWRSQPIPVVGDIPTEPPVCLGT